MYDSIKNSIRSAVYTNGNGDITGQALQDLLVNIVDALNGAAQYKGVAIPSTNPGTPAGRTFYLATQSGTYTNFGSLVLDGTKLAVFVWDGSSWTKTELSVPTSSELSAVSTALSAVQAKQAEGYVYAGVATPATTPATPAGKVFYIAYEAGTYTGFDSFTVSDKVTLFTYSSGWSHKELDVYTSSAMDAALQELSEKALIFGGYEGITWTEGKFVQYDTGLLVSNTSYRYSDFIELDGRYILVNIRGVQNRAGIAFYSSASEAGYISGYGEDDITDETDTILTIPSGANYVRVSNVKTYLDWKVQHPVILNTVIQDLYTQMATLEQNTEVTKDTPETRTSSVDNHYIYTPNNTLTSNSSYEVVLYKLTAGTRYRVIGSTNGRCCTCTVSASFTDSTYSTSLVMRQLFGGTQAGVANDWDEEFTAMPGEEYLAMSKNKSRDLALYTFTAIGPVFETKIAEIDSRLDALEGSTIGVLLIGSSSIHRMQGISGTYSIDNLFSGYSPIVKSGCGGENMKAITGRLGSELMTVGTAFTIPATTTASAVFDLKVRDVQTNFTSQRGADLPHVNPVYIAGVQGTLTYVTDNSYTFTRSTSGDAVDVKAGEKITPKDVKNRGCILVAALGYNGGYDDLNDYLSYQRNAVLYCQPDKFVLMGRIVSGGAWDAPTQDQLDEEAAMDLAYGSNYFNVRLWLARYGIAYGIAMGLLDPGTYPTAADEAAMAADCVPPSLRSDSAHLTNDGYRIVNYRLREIFSELGY